MFYIAKFLVFMAMKTAFSVKLVGKENIPKNTTVIFASNHRTNADPPLISCGLKGKHSFMAKEELFKNKFFGWLIKNLGAFPVSRGKGDSAVLDKAVENLENGRNLMIFPEGTRSKDGKVHRGHSGAAVIAARSGKPIVPVGIVFGEKLKFRTKITINYGEPIYPEDYVEVCDTPNPRQLVKLKNRYMADIKALVEGPPQLEEISEESEKESGNE